MKNKTNIRPAEQGGIQSNLENLGFAGHLLWVYNEEGSGAKFYKSSVYFSDDPKTPLIEGGVTIDPGLDLGHCAKKISLAVINEYFNAGYLTGTQVNLLKSAIGLKTKEAAVWIRKYADAFKHRFLVEAAAAVKVMDAYTAPSFWNVLKFKIPGLLEIKNLKIKKAVHTALLSHAYNRGPMPAVNLAKQHVINQDWEALAHAIREVKHQSKSLNDRREREAALISGAVIFKEEFHITFTNINPLPASAIPHDKVDLVFNKLINGEINV